MVSRESMRPFTGSVCARLHTFMQLLGLDLSHFYEVADSLSRSAHSYSPKPPAQNPRWSSLLTKVPDITPAPSPDVTRKQHQTITLNCVNGRTQHDQNRKTASVCIYPDRVTIYNPGAFATAVRRSVRTVQRTLNRLVVAGYMRRVGAKKTSTWMLLSQPQVLIVSVCVLDCAPTGG